MEQETILTSCAGDGPKRRGRLALGFRRSMPSYQKTLRKGPRSGSLSRVFLRMKLYSGLASSAGVTMFPRIASLDGAVRLLGSEVHAGPLSRNLTGAQARNMSSHIPYGVSKAFRFGRGFMLPKTLSFSSLLAGSGKWPFDD